jgi:hypothetical protein
MALTSWGQLALFKVLDTIVWSFHHPQTSFLLCWLMVFDFVQNLVPVLHQHLFFETLMWWLSMFSILVPLQPNLFHIRIQPCSLRLLGLLLQSFVILPYCSFQPLQASYSFFSMHLCGILFSFNSNTIFNIGIFLSFEEEIFPMGFSPFLQL